MTDWKTIKINRIVAENNNFIEVNLKEFGKNNQKLVAISKGMTFNDKDKFRGNVVFSIDKIDEIIDILQEYKEEVENGYSIK